jgi:hypothetical protein
LESPGLEPMASCFYNPAATEDREGFQRLVTAVSLGQAGIVLGLEVSRLARNSIDWTSANAEVSRTPNQNVSRFLACT